MLMGLVVSLANTNTPKKNAINADNKENNAKIIIPNNIQFPFFYRFFQLKRNKTYIYLFGIENNIYLCNKDFHEYYEKKRDGLLMSNVKSFLIEYDMLRLFH